MRKYGLELAGCHVPDFEILNGDGIELVGSDLGIKQSPVRREQRAVTLHSRSGQFHTDPARRRIPKLIATSSGRHNRSPFGREDLDPCFLLMPEGLERGLGSAQVALMAPVRTRDTEKTQ